MEQDKQKQISMVPLNDEFKANKNKIGELSQTKTLSRMFSMSDSEALYNNPVKPENETDIGTPGEPVIKSRVNNIKINVTQMENKENDEMTPRKSGSKLSDLIKDVLTLDSNDDMNDLGDLRELNEKYSMEANLSRYNTVKYLSAQYFARTNSFGVNMEPGQFMKQMTGGRDESSTFTVGTVDNDNAIIVFYDLNKLYGDIISYLSDIERWKYRIVCQQWKMLIDKEYWIFKSNMNMLDIKKLDIGDKIDYRNIDGKYIKADIIDNKANQLKIHFDNCDIWIDINKNYKKMAKYESITNKQSIRCKIKKIGFELYINPILKHPGWKHGIIKIYDDNSGQIQVMYKSGNKEYLYWTHLDNKNEIKFI